MEFAKGQLPQQVHEAMIKKNCSAKLVGHASRDSTPIRGREKPVKKNKKPRSKDEVLT